MLVKQFVFRFKNEYRLGHIANIFKNILKKHKYVKRGDKVINIASMPAEDRGMTNMMKLSKVK